MRPLFGQIWGWRGIFGQVRGGASFTVTITGESTDSLGPYARVGNHAAIGYTETPTSGIETVKWSNSSNPASAATYGTGANPTDFTAGDTGTLWLHVTIGAEVVSRSIPIRRLPATGGADLNLSFVENVAISSTNLIANWTTNGNTLTFVSIVPPLPPGLSINSAGTMTGTPTSVAADDTYTLTMQDANGRQVSDTFTLEVVVGVQATAVDLQAQEAGTGDVPAVISGDEGLYWWIFTTTDPDVNAPSRAQVVAGQTHTGSAAPASGTVTTIANPGTVPVPLPSGLNGVHFLVLADSDSVIWDGVGQAIDTTAPVLSDLTGTQTGQTTADWDVTSDKAGGTIYAGVRPSASAALTEAQLIAGSGGAGVDFDSDATPTADSANGGSFTGLTAGTAYRVDSVHVDALGNVSAVETSAEFTTAAAPSLIFDQMIALGYTPTFGYSLRKLRDAYAGAAIRVRRSSDNTEQDIGFVGEDLDTAALLAFAGAGDAFIRSWYDQWTGGRTCSNATAAQQPRIVASGALVVLPGTTSRPGADFNRSATQYLDSATGQTVTVNALNAVAARGDVDGNRGIFWVRNSGSGSECTIRMEAAVVSHRYNGGKGTSFGWGGTFPTTRATITWCGQDSGSWRLFGNGTQLSTAAAADTDPTSTGANAMRLGSVGSNWMDGWISEVTAFTTSLATADRQTLENNQAAYWV